MSITQVYRSFLTLEDNYPNSSRSLFYPRENQARATITHIKYPQTVIPSTAASRLSSPPFLSALEYTIHSPKSQSNPTHLQTPYPSASKNERNPESEPTQLAQAQLPFIPRRSTLISTLKSLRDTSITWYLYISIQVTGFAFCTLGRASREDMEVATCIHCGL